MLKKDTEIPALINGYSIFKERVGTLKNKPNKHNLARLFLDFIWGITTQVFYLCDFKTKRIKKLLSNIITSVLGCQTKS